MSKSIYEIFLSHAIKNPTKEALVCGKTRLSYDELLKNTHALAAGLKSIGIGANTHVGIMLNNSEIWASIMLAISAINAVLVPIAVSTKLESLKTQLKSSDVKVLIVDGLQASFFANELSDIVIITTNKRVEGLAFFDDIIKLNHSFKVQKIDPNLPYILTMTSGSTSKPKPIIFSQNTKINRALLATKDEYSLNCDDVILVSTPLYHSLAQRSILLPLLIGAKAIILPRYDINSWLKCLQDEKVSFLFSISSWLESVANSGLVKSYDISSLKTLISSSAPLSLSARKAILDEFKHALVYEIYGTSEVGVVTNLLINERFGSVGKPLSFVEIKINQTQIQVKSKTAFLGYYKNELATKQSYDGKYFKTGDMGRIDSDGYLYYLGRLKDVIITGGVNVLASDVETAILTHDAISECAVVSKPDERFGEIVIAFVVLKNGFKVSECDILAFCLKMLNDYQIPRQIHILKDLPKSGLGKVLKGELRSML